MESILVAAGYSVVRAASGAEALRVVHTQKFDAILMDIEMPGLDGWALCRVLKADARTSGIPVVFMTARHGGDDQIVRALAMGGADYVHKPVHAEIVVRRIGVLVRAHRAEAEQRRLAEDRADALAALGAAQAQALEARKLSGLSTMARGLAHEINNPLAAAMSEVAYVASGRGTGEDRAEALAAAISSLERVKHIVDRMRRLGDEVETSAPIALDGVVRAAVEPLVSLLASRGDRRRAHPRQGAAVPQRRPHRAGRRRARHQRRARDARGRQASSSRSVTPTARPISPCATRAAA